MLKKFVGAAIVMVLVASVAFSETMSGIITKIEDDKTITFVPVEGKGKKAKQGEPVTFTFDKSTVKVSKKGKKGKDAEESTYTDFAKAVSEAKKGVAVSIEVTEKKVTAITHGGGRMKKKKTDTE